MTGPSALFQALLRPAILQILRASGYHSTKGAVLDALTDLAARYLSALCEATAGHAAHNHGDAGAYSLADVAIALRELGALLPDKAASEQVFLGADDVRGVDDFVAWFAGPRMRDLMEMGRADGDASDYLTGAPRALPPVLSPPLTLVPRGTAGCSPEEEAQQDGRRHKVSRHPHRQAARGRGRDPGGGRPGAQHRRLADAATDGLPAAPRRRGRRPGQRPSLGLAPQLRPQLAPRRPRARCRARADGPGALMRPARSRGAGATRVEICRRELTRKRSRLEAACVALGRGDIPLFIIFDRRNYESYILAE